MADTADASLPSVLILGGTMTVARALVVYLLGPGAGSGTGEKKASFVRLADRFSVSPPSTYLDQAFLEILNAPSPDSAFEYKQVNLALKEKHEEVFTVPDSRIHRQASGQERKGFDYIFDLTGETGAEKSELLHSHAYSLSLSLATSATTFPLPLRPSAYIRLTFPYYEMKSPSPLVESAELRPDGVRGRWWHETLRGLGALQRQGLRLGVGRCAAGYGVGGWEGEVVARLVVGHVYKYLKEEMKFLYNSDLRVHTVHNADISFALLLLARYTAATPPSEITTSSVEIPFSFAPPAPSLFSQGKRGSISEAWKTVPTVIPEKEKVAIPLFDIVDEGDSTQGSLAKAVAEVWGVEWGFLNSTMASLVEKFAKTDFAEMVEDVNEKHVEAWSAMLASSTPAIGSTPITPFLDEHAFKKRAICLDGSKAKRVLGFKPAYPKVTVEELKRIIKAFQDDRIWPIVE